MPDAVRTMADAGKPRPETRAFAACLFDQENILTHKFCEQLCKCNWQLVAPIYGAVLACPLPGASSLAEERVVAEFEQESGVKKQVRGAGRESIATTKTAADALRCLLDCGSTQFTHDLKMVPGAHKCLPFAIVNVFAAEAPDLHASFMSGDGPFSFRQPEPKYDGPVKTLFPKICLCV